MSSKPVAAQPRIKLRAIEDGTSVRASIPREVVKTRGRRQPQADDFEVVVDLPPSPPILDRELRAIEILLGRELQDLLTGVAADSLEKWGLTGHRMRLSNRICGCCELVRIEF